MITGLEKKKPIHHVNVVGKEDKHSALLLSLIHVQYISSPLPL